MMSMMPAEASSVVILLWVPCPWTSDETKWPYEHWADECCWSYYPIHWYSCPNSNRSWEPWIHCLVQLYKCLFGESWTVWARVVESFDSSHPWGRKNWQDHRQSKRRTHPDQSDTAGVHHNFHPSHLLLEWLYLVVVFFACSFLFDEQRIVESLEVESCCGVLLRTCNYLHSCCRHPHLYETFANWECPTFPNALPRRI